MFKELLNKLKKNKKSQTIKFNPNLITDEVILNKSEAGLVLHNCGFDKISQTYRIVTNDVMSIKICGEMLKEFTATSK